MTDRPTPQTDRAAGKARSGKIMLTANDLDNYGGPRSDYFARLDKMNDAELFRECKHRILLSAYAANNPRSDYHWQCDATWEEAKKRDKNASIYTRAHDEVSKSC